MRIRRQDVQCQHRKRESWFNDEVEHDNSIAEQDDASMCLAENSTNDVNWRTKPYGIYIHHVGWKSPCWFTPLGKDVPLSMHINDPYLEDDPMWVKATTALNSVELNNDEGTFSFKAA